MLSHSAKCVRFNYRFKLNALDESARIHNNASANSLSDVGNLT